MVLKLKKTNLTLNYYNELPVDTLDEEALMMFVGIYLTILAVVLVLAVAAAVAIVGKELG